MEKLLKSSNAFKCIFVYIRIVAGVANTGHVLKRTFIYFGVNQQGNTQHPPQLGEIEWPQVQMLGRSI